MCSLCLRRRKTLSVLQDWIWLLSVFLYCGPVRTTSWNAKELTDPLGKEGSLLMVCKYKLHSLYLRDHGHKGAVCLSTSITGWQLMMFMLPCLLSLVLFSFTSSFSSEWLSENILGPESDIVPLLEAVPCAPERGPVALPWCFFLCTLYLAVFLILPMPETVSFKKKISLKKQDTCPKDTPPVTCGFLLGPSF